MPDEPARAVDIDPDKCVVGRALVNDELDGWNDPCRFIVVEECVLPNGMVLPFCRRHSAQWRKALIKASAYRADVLRWEERYDQS